LRTNSSENEEINRLITTDDSTINDNGIGKNNNKNNDDIDLENTNRFFENMNDQMKYNHLNLLNYFKDIQNANDSLLKDELKKIETIQNIGNNGSNMLQLDHLVKQNLNLVRDFNAALEISKIKIPIINENQILIHGRVTDKDFKGISNLSVLLVDKKGKDIGVCSTTTDSSGYYSIIMDKDKKEKILKEITAKGGLYITVLTADNKVIYKSPSPLKLESSVLLYELIVSNK